MKPAKSKSAERDVEAVDDNCPTFALFVAANTVLIVVFVVSVMAFAA